MARYEITAPDGNKYEVTAPDGATEDQVLQYAQGQFKSSAKAPERSFGDSLIRQAGLTARSAVGGLGGIANMVADPIVSGINAVAGTNLPIPSQALERTMTRAGLPEPASGTERFSQAVNRGMIGAAAGKYIPGNNLPLKDQVVAGGAAAGGSEVAKEADLSPGAQFAVGIGTGIVAPSVLTGAAEGLKAVGRSLPALAEPLTAAGRDRMKARALQGAASDAQSAAIAARNAPEYVPGSVPTLAQATGDSGIAAQSKALQARFTSDFADRAAAQDAARQAGLEKSFGTPATLNAAEVARDTATTALRDQAFANAKKVNVNPILKSADTIIASGAGKRQEVEKAMSWVKSRLDGETDPQRVYAVRQDINDIIAGKLSGDPDKASLKLASSQLIAIRGILDKQLEKSAPGFRRYLDTYAGMSREIDKVKLGQEIRQAATNNYQDTLSGPKFANQMASRAEDIGNSGAIASDALTRVNMDLKRAAAPVAQTRAPGSDTLQNMVANNMLSRAGVSPSGPVSNAATRILSYPYKWFGTEDQLLQGLRDAHLDPQEGARLLSMQLSKLPKADLENLLRRLSAYPVGGLLGVNAGK